MKNRALCSVLRAACFALCAAEALPVLATTYYVDAENGDDGYDGTAPDAAKQSFDEAVRLLSAKGDVLKFAPGTYESSVGFVSSLSSLVFEGTDENRNPSNVVLSGKCACRLFKLTGDDITFRNLTIAHCRSNDGKEGGALSFPTQDGAKCTIDNCVFFGNTNANHDAGAVFSERSLTVINSVFDSNASENPSKGRAGALNMKGHAATHIISNCVFRNNQCIGNSDNGGGAVYCYRDQYNIKVLGCLFENNRSTEGRGGGFRGQYNLMSNCVFRGNFAANAGALVGKDTDGTMWLVDCLFTNNVARGAAGAFFTVNKNGHHVVKCTFVDNHALTGWAGAVEGYLFEEITGCTFRSCTATNNAGGAINGCPKAMRDCTFENCRSRQWGGAWAVNPNIGTTVAGMSPMIVTNCVFTGNSICPYRYDNSHSDCGGTAVDLHNYDKFGFYKCTFKENFMTNAINRNGASGTYVDGNGNPWPFSKVGGPIWSGALTCWGDTRLDECDFIGNVGPSSGAAFYGCSTGGIRRCRFIGNNAYYCGENGVGSQTVVAHGAAICYRYKRTVTVNEDGSWSGQQLVEDCEFTSNRVCGIAGAAIHTTSGGLEIRRCSFTGNEVCATNTADSCGRGGVIALDTQRGQGVDNACKDVRYQLHFRVEDCAFTNNTGIGFGGVITAYGVWQTNVCTVGTVRNCLFTGNTCKSRLNTTSGDYVGSGGAIGLSTRQTVAIENCTFVDNEAASTGGAIYQGSSNGSSVTNCVFYDNVDAKSGVATDDLYLSSNAKLNIGHCFARTGGQLTDNVNGNIVNDKNPFRSDDHCDLALRSDCGAGAGVVLGWMASSTDIGGKPRLSEGAVDFGCYQLWFKPGFLMLIR